VLLDVVADELQQHVGHGLALVAVAALKSLASFTSRFRFIFLNPSFRGIAHLLGGSKEVSIP
jgi:hypothetical protein